MRSLPAATLIEVARSYEDPRLLCTIEPPTGPTLRFSDRYIAKRTNDPITLTVDKIINGPFDGGVVPWIADDSGGVSSWGGAGVLSLSGGANVGHRAARYQSISVSAGDICRLKFKIPSVTGLATSVDVTVGSTVGGFDLVGASLLAGVYEYAITATTATISVRFQISGNALFTGAATIDDVVLLVPITVADDRVRPEYLPFVAAWPTITESINPLDAGGATTTGDGLKLCNTKPIYVLDTGERFDNLGDFLETYPLTNAKLTISRLGPSLSPDGEVVLGRLYVEDITDLDQPLLGLRLADRTLLLEDALPLVRCTRETLTLCPRASLDKVIPVPFGRLTKVPAIPIVDGAGSTLSTALTDSDTSVVLEDVDLSDDFPASGTVLIEQELIAYTGKTGRTLTGCTRGASSTTAAEHPAGASVFEARTTYVFGVAQGDVTLSNIRVNGKPARTSPVSSLDSNLVPGSPLKVITFTASDLKAFHVSGAGGAASVVVASVNVTDPGTSTSRTIPMPTTFETTGPTRRTVQYTVGFSGGSPGWNVERRLASGAWVRIASGASTLLPYTSTHTADYDSLADEEIRLNITSGSGYNVTMTFNEYTVESGSGQGSGGSTSAAVIGEVTCDVVGIADDGYGSITGVGGTLLEVPADIARWIHLNLYGLTAADLGSRWAAARAQHVNGHLRWAFLLGFDGPVKYSELRRKIGEQSRSRIVVTEGLIDLVYQADVVTPDQTLDYDREVWDGQAAIAAKTNATQRFTRVIAKGQRDYAQDRYLYTITPDETPDGENALETTLTCDFVQDPGVVAAMAAWRLREVKSQLWQTRATAWQNALALQGCDVVAFASHPNLAESLLLRLIGKTYELGSEQPSRIALTAVEVPA